MGPEAYRFVDFLVDAGQSLWQILPLNPTDPAYGNSPYSSSSAFAANFLLVSPELLIEQGLLTREDLEPKPSFPEKQCDYALVISYKKRILNRAYERFKKEKRGDFDFPKFCYQNSIWLEDFALFVTLKEHFGGKLWSRWPPPLRDRDPKSLKTFKDNFKDRINREKFIQYLFFKQWFLLKDYCYKKGIQLIGDIPIYVNYDSVDAWAYPEIFKLDEEKKPSFVAGVPPDYYSRSGQLWGNPIYRWDILREKGYQWWIQRMAHNFNLFDLVRVDHFRGFVSFWEVPAGEQTAIRGRWTEAPAQDFFHTLLKRFPYLPVIAEDLGIITPDVREIMRQFGFPGMRVLLFAFGKDTAEHPYAPHNYVKNCVVYTGTHDNNTVRGWFEHEATEEEKRRLFGYTGKEVKVEKINWELIRLAMMSVANILIVPLQDILGLGEEARMNRPATTQGNWRWRFLVEQLSSQIKQKLREMTETYGRI